MAPLTLIYQGDGALHPATTDDVRALGERFGEGELIETELRPVQSSGQKRFWAMINAAYLNSDEAKRWKTVELLAEAVKIAVKHRQANRTLDGEMYWSAKSLAAIRDWDRFNDAVKTTLEAALGVDPAVLALPDTEERQSVSPRPGASLNELIDKVVRFCGDTEAWEGQQPAHLKSLETLEKQWQGELGDVVKPVFTYGRQLVLARHQNNAKAMADLRKVLRNLKQEEHA